MQLCISRMELTDIILVRLIVLLYVKRELRRLDGHVNLLLGAAPFILACVVDIMP